MKRTALLVIALIAGLAVSNAQPELRMEWSRGAAMWTDTVYATSVKVAMQNVGHGVYGVQIVNRGKLGGGSGYLYVGFISGATKGQDARTDTTTTLTNQWMRTWRLYPAVSGGTDYNTIFNPKCTADTIWLKSTDSVSVDIYQW